MEFLRCLRLPKNSLIANFVRNLAANEATSAEPYRIPYAVDEKQNFVGGRRLKPEKSNRHFQVFEPATGKFFDSLRNFGSKYLETLTRGIFS